MNTHRRRRAATMITAAGLTLDVMAAGHLVLAEPAVADPKPYQAALNGATPAKVRAAKAEAARPVPRFRSYLYLPTTRGFHPARTFRLSQDYPARLAPNDAAVERILKIDFRRDWKRYSRAVFDYAMAGNTSRPGVSDDFFLEDNKVRRWVHVPWQDFGDNGREGMHGLTAEGPVTAGTLGPRHTHNYQSYAVGFYNARGAYTIGRVWADAKRPDVDAVAGRGFPVGTIVAKLLFTNAPPDEVPFLSNSVDWVAYIKDIKPSLPGDKPIAGPVPALPTKRLLATVRLIQMDVMVRDDRAAATGGWVFGTYVYNGTLANADRWRNLVPVGLSWGDDPTVRSHEVGNAAPTATLINPDLKHTAINADAAQMPPMHLGFGLRLSGPVDNVHSSCEACHTTAQIGGTTPLLPFMRQADGTFAKPGDAAWMRYFRDIPAGQPFDVGAKSMDNSLQLEASIANFNTAEDAARAKAGLVRLPRPLMRNVTGSRGSQPGDQ